MVYQGFGRRVGLAAAGVIVGVAPALADVCASMGPSQFVPDMRFCVSSALAPQGGNDYGPENLFDGNSRSAWCEGVSGPGLYEQVTISFPGEPVFRRLYVENGYGKSARSYAENARPRTVDINASNGFALRLQLADTAAPQYLNLPGAAGIGWIRLTVIDIYPGSKYQDTCMSYLMPDFEYEEELLQQGQ